MTTLLIIPGNYLPHIGGLETHVYEFSKECAKRGHSITIFAPQNPRSAAPYEKHNGMTIIRYPCIVAGGNPFPALWRCAFWTQLSRLQPQTYDLIMTRTRFFFATLFGYAYARRHHLPLMHVEHGSSHVHSSSRIVNAMSTLWDHTVGKHVLRHSDMIISISRAVRDFVHHLSGRDSPIIRRGIDTAALDRVNASKKIKGKTTFVFAGRLTKWKGVDHIISAAQSLPPSVCRKLHISIIGDGPERARLERDAPPCVSFLGEQTYETTWSIMKSCTYYLHSAQPGGGLSSSLLQAMYLGCIPIASPHEGANEVVNSTNGVLLKDNSAEQLRLAIEQVVRQAPKIQTAHTRKMLRQDYSWPRAVTQYEHVWNTRIRK